MTVKTGLPLGLPVSLALFSLRIADIHGEVEDQVEDSRGISYVDDVTWIVDGVVVGQGWSSARRFPGHIVVEDREPALRTASTWDRPNTV